MNPITMKLVVDDLILQALREDITFEDVSTASVCPTARPATVELIAKADGIIAGLDVFARTFELLDSQSSVLFDVADGDEVHAGDHVGQVRGDARVLLSGERVALNYLQRMSGIATYTHRMAAALEGTKTVLVDTRKTTPGMRVFEKAAVEIGGGSNHRYNLSTAVMLKDNHIDAAGGVTRAIEMARAHASFTTTVEIECENLDMVREAVEAGADIILIETMADLLETKAAGPEALEELHRVWDFRSFDRAWLPFILPMLGSGEVRITLHDGLARMEETGIPALWRLQMGGHDSFILGRIPRCVWLAARSGEETVGTIVNNGSDVFAAPAILEELRAAQQKIDWSRLPEDPAHMVELTKQPLSPGDSRAILSTLGTGDIRAEITGFAKSTINRTGVRGIWHTKMLNNAGKPLLDAYVCAVIPPEVASPCEAFDDTVERCREMVDWVEKDLERGAIGGEPVEEAR